MSGLLVDSASYSAGMHTLVGSAELRQPRPALPAGARHLAAARAGSVVGSAACKEQVKRQQAGFSRHTKKEHLTS